MDPQLLATLRADVWLSAPNARDEYGTLTHMPPEARKARVIGRRALIREPGGQEVVSEQSLILAAPVVIDTIVHLPGEDPANDQGHRVLAVSERIGERGELDHVRAWLTTLRS